MKMVDLVEVAYDQLLELFDECKTDGTCGSSPGNCATWCIASATAGWAAAKNRRQVARVSARSDGRGYSSAPLTGTAREARRARPRPRRLPLPCARPSRRMGRSARLGALARPPCVTRRSSSCAGPRALRGGAPSVLLPPLRPFAWHYTRLAKGSNRPCRACFHDAHIWKHRLSPSETDQTNKKRGRLFGFPRFSVCAILTRYFVAPQEHV